MNRGHLAVLLISSMLLLAVGVAIRPSLSAQPAGMVPVIIMFREKPDASLVRRHGGEVKVVYHVRPGLAAWLPPEAIDVLRRVPVVEYVVEDLEIFPVEQTTPWGVSRIGAEVVHAYNTGDGVNVAVMDTGIDYNHPDLDDNYYGGYDFGGDVSGGPNDPDPMDFDGHGTHVAGIVAAEDNGFGVVGVAPDAHLYAVKVFSDDGVGRYSDVVEGLEWCIDTRTDGIQGNDIRVISMSIGSRKEYGDPGIEPWINDAYAVGILLVGAAGNEGNPGGGGDNVIYPARYDAVIAVGATDQNDKRAGWSSTGPDLELVAPGVDVYSTWLGGGYKTLSGTSMSCPHVSGAAALVMVSYPRFNNSQVRERLQVTADDLGDAGRDTRYGFGLVDADEAAPETRQDVYLLLTVEPVQATYSRGQTVTFEVGVFNEMGTALDSTLTLTVSGPDGYWHSDLQRVSVGVYFYAANVWVYTFGWSVPGGAAGTYWVEVGLVPPRLTAYDAVWLEVV